jgi:transcriptional regulator with PAS, ATPase and Fis domain
MLGRSQAILRLREFIAKAAPSKSAILIVGETGVGKDVASQEIHDLSGRKGNYIPINCSTFGEGLIESELFGHEKGAFTSAVERRLGVFEQANNGTVFLDEITEMKLELQAKLLRVLEDHHVARLGGQGRISVNVRVIAATNRSPQDAITQGRLRPDLYYRLKVFNFLIPPLRERIEDLEDFVPHFIEAINLDEGKEVDGVDSECLAALKTYPWPGNIRELRNILAQAVVTCGRGRLTVADLPEEVYKVRHREDHFVVRIGATMAEIKREAAVRTLDASDGNHTRAAEILRISRHAPYDLLHNSGLPRRRRGSNQSDDPPSS